jgi:hypothetical protein
MPPSDGGMHMIAYSSSADLGWHWVWLILGPILLLLPLVFWKGHRVAYLMGLCAVFIAALGTFWIRDWGRIEAGQIRVDTRDMLYDFGLASQHGALRFSYVQRSSASSIRRNSVSYVREDYDEGYPQVRFSPGVHPSIAINGWGFQAYYLYDVAMRGRRVDIIMPQWFAIGILALVPGMGWLFGSVRKRRRVAVRRRNNMCEKCGYMLNGLPEPVRCPECGMFRLPASCGIDRAK